MEKFTLKRVSYTDSGAFGVLIYRDIPFAVTLEPDWKDNKTNVSCIPSGEYVCKPYSSDKYTGVYQVVDVLGRTSVLLHIGNTIEDTMGCVLVAEEYGVLDGDPAVLRSTHGFEEFLALAGGADIKLNIIGDTAIERKMELATLKLDLERGESLPKLLELDKDVRARYIIAKWLEVAKDGYNMTKKPDFRPPWRKHLSKAWRIVEAALLVGSKFIK